MDTLVIVKTATVALLVFLALLTAQCPCPRLLCCHLQVFWIGMAAVVALVLFENGLKLSDPTC